MTNIIQNLIFTKPMLQVEPIPAAPTNLEDATQDGEVGVREDGSMSDDAEER